jgi:hypothetical protein
VGPLPSSRQPGPNNIDRRMQTAAVELVSARPASQGVNSILESAVHTPTHRHTRPCTQWAVKASLHCQREARAHSRRVQRDRRPDSACSPVLQPTGCMGGGHLTELLVRSRRRGPANRRVGDRGVAQDLLDHPLVRSRRRGPANRRVGDRGVAQDLLDHPLVRTRVRGPANRRVGDRGVAQDLLDHPLVRSRVRIV